MKANCYKCDKCRDTGWILIPQEEYAPKTVRCECEDAKRIKNQWIAAGINPEYSNQTFSNFEVWNEGSRKVKAAALAYYKNFIDIRRKRKNSILFCGQVGGGKTHISVALAINLINRQNKVIYMPYRDVVTKIKQNMMDDEYYKKIISRYQTCDVLLMDDLFKGKINESDVNIVFEILNYRYLNYLPLIISTEFTLERLLDFDEAIGSRIYEMCKDYTVEIPLKRENNYRLKV